jgi:hypothetical protein
LKAPQWHEPGRAEENHKIPDENSDFLSQNFNLPPPAYCDTEIKPGYNFYIYQR